MSQPTQPKDNLEKIQFERLLAEAHAKVSKLEAKEEHARASAAEARLKEQEAKARLLEAQAKAAEAHAKAIAAEDSRKSEELNQARRIQRFMLPVETPVMPNLDFGVYFKTATEVGGDYYDFFPWEDGSFYTVIGDATGHGIGAGMMVSMVKASLNALEIKEPNRILGRLNKIIRKLNPGKMKMGLCVVRIEDNHIEVASAGMPPIYLYSASAGKVDEVLISGLPLGGMLSEVYESREFPFIENDMLIMLSDGLPERENPKADFLGYDAIKECIGEHGGSAATELVRRLVALGESWADGVFNHDDIAIIAIKRKESE